jgi:hypothetical protein
MTSIRGGQALAMILRDPGPMLDLPHEPELPPEPDPLPEPELPPEPVPFPDPVIETPPEVVDISIQDRYNSLDLGELIDLARMLSVDISNDKNKGMFNIKKVRRTVKQYLDDHNWPEKQLKRLFKRKPK